MKNSNLIENFNTVSYFREIKDKISSEIWGLSYEEMMAYFKNRVPQKRILPSA
ncbi:MAG: hypothetical protein LBN95_09435 [Prevotellaceae bacterium]|jgi:hypothetical protein|nr:hypothetical protein [Prevotellaceae bacterium]